MQSPQKREQKLKHHQQAETTGAGITADVTNQRISQKMKRINLFLWITFGVLSLGISGCNTSNLIDTNVELPNRNWSYVDKVKAVVGIKDPAKAFTIKFKLRHTADYRYANIFILMHILLQFDGIITGFWKMVIG